MPAGWEGDDLIDDEHEIGPVDAEVVVRVEKGDGDEEARKEASLKVVEGQAAPETPDEMASPLAVRGRPQAA